ncbi:protein ROOT HAIR DEFECTIVE 3 homolog 2-like isoform X1 [Rosa rugosa]|uniref:protein ROOT HAIR DEFECTIVE 3 homolog 2-like isoform X1 n=1 Tax=Rosa rugosa TaxID=74645 RepID=UPI002B414CB5|nr:protein ROOT HAIR DEFECTIVE 3 homolog 2-like isoform X1 [Rosa rugosa]XP_062018291.1 protein ROOT HAIR DEFECTIVE 3 homolog 2-like isoform X1 [Rosa rugosa]XP_062018292.1 protein ROOT HAIR DEFECTIVE 3 homolog 2-like isoform X1 [Rosa rugosa]
MKKDDSCIMQLINAKGEFNASGLDNFVKEVKLDSCGVFYNIVSIMGPQGGGKSTLLNQLFGTKFRVMDSHRRTQTTKGVWIAKCVGIKDCTVAMDLEGTDSEERGQDDTSFEKQVVLFALAVSDILLINMCYKEIGREHAANKPLLRTVFQVMMQINIPKRKKTLLFVIRDADTSENHRVALKDQLLDNIQKIWAEVQKHAGTQLNDIFVVEVVALSHYRYEKDTFNKEVDELRLGKAMSMAGNREGVIPGDAFSFSSQKIWEEIKTNKELNLPSIKVLAANFMCENMAKKKFNQLISSKDWLDLVEAVKNGPVEGSGERLSSILDTHLSGYDEEAKYYDKGVRDSKRHDLLEQTALDFVLPAYTTMLRRLHSRTLENFKVELKQSLNNSGEGSTSSVSTCINSSMQKFDQGCKETAMQRANWDSSSTRKNLQLEINEHVDFLRRELIINSKEQLSESISASARRLLEDGGQDTWIEIRKLFNHETEAAVKKLSTALARFELDKVTIHDKVQELRVHAREAVVKQAKREAVDVKLLSDMKEQFENYFKKHSDSNLEFWKGKENIGKNAMDAHKNCLKLLSVRAAIRLDAEKPDSIENALISSLMGENGESTNSLTSSEWLEFSSDDTIIKPPHCKELWKKFEEQTKEIVEQATLAWVNHRSRKTAKVAKAVGKIALELTGVTLQMVGIQAHIAGMLWQN